MPSIVEIIFKTIKQGDGDKQTTKGLGDMVKSMAGAVGGYAALGTAALAAANYLRESAKAAAESAQVDAKLEAILKATGNAAGITADELDNLANSLSKQAGIDDELIKSAEGLMLTFRNVAGDTFPRAMQAAVDLQTTFGSLEASTMQLGKALNDPVAGMGALARSGVTFSDTQKEQIKNFVATNQLAKAQAVILAEVENQVGGTAAAINAAGDGSENLNIAWGNLSEAIGARLLPETRSFNMALTDMVDAVTENVEASNALAEAQRKVYTETGRTFEQQQRYAKLTENTSQSVDALAAEWIRAEEYGKAWEKVIKSQTQALDENGGQAILTAEQIEEANKATTKYYEGQLSNIGSVQSAYDKFSDSTADLTQQHADLQAEIDGLIKQGWSPMSEKVTDLKDKQAALADKMVEVQKTYSEALNQMVLDQIKLNLAADGVFDETDFQKYLDVAGAMGLMDEKSIELAKAQEQLAAMFTAGKISADELKTKLDMLSSGKYDIDVVLKTLMTGITGDFAVRSDSESFAASEGGKKPDDMRASGTGGAWMTVPPGYPGDSYTVGMSSGERYNVQTASQASQPQQSGPLELSPNSITALGRELVFAMQTAGVQ